MNRTQYWQDQKDTTTVTGTSAVTVFEVDMRGRKFLSFKIKPVSEALTACVLEGKVGFGDAAWVTLVSTTAQWTTPSGMVFGADGGDLNALAAGSTGVAIIEQTAFAKMRLRVTAAGVGTIIHSYGAS